MNIQGKVAIVTGAAGGIGRAVATELVKRGVAALAAVGRSDSVKQVAATLNESSGGQTCVVPFVGDVTDDTFRSNVFDQMTKSYGTPAICVPAAGITRDKLSVRLNKETGTAMLYPEQDFLTVLKVNLLTPVYWGLQLVGKVAESRHGRSLTRWGPPEEVEAIVVFIGSVSAWNSRPNRLLGD